LTALWDRKRPEIQGQPSRRRPRLREGHLGAVDLAGGGHGSAERQADAGGRPSVHLDHPDDELVALFGLLEGEDADAGIVHGQEREGPAERALVGRAFEGAERLVQAEALPIRRPLPEISGVAREPVDELVTAQIERGLVGIAPPHARRADQGEAESAVVRLVRGVLAIGEDGRPERAAPVGEIDPLVRGDLELAVEVGRPLDRPDVPVIRREGIRGGEREDGLEMGFPGHPVHMPNSRRSSASPPRGGLDERRASACAQRHPAARLDDTDFAGPQKASARPAVVKSMFQAANCGDWIADLEPGRSSIPPRPLSKMLVTSLFLSI
jgi:hypothetical protein